MSLSYDLLFNLLLSLFGILAAYLIIARSLAFKTGPPNETRVVLMTFTPHGTIFEALDHDPFSHDLIELVTFGGGPTATTHGEPILDPSADPTSTADPPAANSVGPTGTAHELRRPKSVGPTTTTTEEPKRAKSVGPTTTTTEEPKRPKSVGPTTTTTEEPKRAKSVGPTATQEPRRTKTDEVAVVQARRDPLLGGSAGVGFIRSEVLVPISDPNRTRSGFKERCAKWGGKIGCGCFGAAIRVAE